jgi:hypothetical protein
MAVKPGDAILTLGAGNVSQAGEEILWVLKDMDKKKSTPRKGDKLASDKKRDGEKAPQKSLGSAKGRARGRAKG